MTNSAEYLAMRAFVETWIAELSLRKCFTLANRLHDALEVAEHSIMLYSEVLLAYQDARDAKQLTAEEESAAEANILKFIELPHSS